ncbi:MAG: hypothetical protein ACTJHT_01330 [Sphingobacterium sp.]|uniref:hypothetical protein n=1 Tax=Sphingobacterium sp. JB170 TaxID=1434842 RepID=UPI00097F1697|nr:hypothetical protein [Sphingobacterium sp. JB170]SJN23235.1 hypothetical protein FM107_03795 [Sphingobacterium sp. JB170]
MQVIEAVIKLAVRSLSDVKNDVQKRGFKYVDAEILVFKYLKPVIVSTLIYYNATLPFHWNLESLF